MCFHTKQTKEAQKLEHRFKAKLVDSKGFSPMEHNNGFSFPKTPVICNNNSSEIEMIPWGLIPHWATKDWNKTYTLNARIETIKEKKSFKDITKNRCIIIVDGFFEWKHIGKQKVKYDIGIKNKLFVLAGLYDTFEDQKRYTILTTEAKGIMKEIHNTKMRMPIALNNDEQMSSWLLGNEVEPFSDFSTKALDNLQAELF